MKSLIKFFTFIITFFKNRKKNKTFTEINAKLEKKLKDREVDKIILKGEIIKMCRKFLGVDAKSKFIPKKYKNNTKIRERVLAEFGPRMKDLNIRINENLELV